MTKTNSRSAVVTVLVWIGFGLAQSTLAAAANDFVPPSFSVADLQSGSRSKELVSVLSSTGLLAVNLGEDKELVRETALQGLCQCSSLLESLSDEHKSISASTLMDDTTRRTTLATATVGDNPLSIAEDETLVSEACGEATVKAMESMRDQAAFASSAFIQALDRILGGPAGASAPLLRTKHGVQYHSVEDIVRSSTHLEHFHIYHRDGNRDGVNLDDDTGVNDDTLQMHTDAGLFLSFVPAHSCAGGDLDSSFFLLDPISEQRLPVSFPMNSIIIMLGLGAEQWLSPARHDVRLQATRHAVKMQSGSSRAWYGMMHLVPESAVVSRHGTFADMKQSFSRIGDDQEEAIFLGCGNEGDANRDHILTKVASSNTRRRLQHVQDPSACNNSTNFFCWMQCLDIPNHKQAVGYITEGYSLYCLDPAVLAASGNRVSAATGPCENGFIHNSNCLGSWQPTAPGVSAAELSMEVPQKQEQFCYGGTSMYMDGFHWLDTTCVILLFEAWTLTSPGRLAAACVGLLLFGILLEMVIRQRRAFISHMKPGYRRLAASGVVYGIQLTMGYFVMLAVMTYSGPLFLSAVFGLVAGHVMFNARDALFWQSNDKPEIRKSARIQLEDRDTSSEELEQNRKSAPKPSDSRVSYSSVPEGITPCCQNDL